MIRTHTLPPFRPALREPPLCTDLTQVYEITVTVDDEARSFTRVLEFRPDFAAPVESENTVVIGGILEIDMTTLEREGE